jgi:PAS domain S-box-containing protein
MESTTVESGTFSVRKMGLTETDMIRIIVIASLAISCSLITMLAFSRSLVLIGFQLFYIPIFYAAYAYPKKALLMGALCGVAFQAVGYYYSYPDITALTAITVQALLFIIVGGVIAYLIVRIRTSEQLNRVLTESPIVGVVQINPATLSIRKTNSQFCRMLGFDSDDLTDTDFPSFFVVPGERARLVQLLHSAVDGTGANLKVRAKGGRISRVRISWLKISDTTIACTIIDDNTAGPADQDSLNPLEGYTHLAENLPTGILLIQGGVVKYFNKSFSDFIGAPPEEISGNSITSFIAPEYRQEFIGQCSTWERSPETTEKVDFWFECSNGRRVASVFAVPIASEESAGLLLNLVDMSEKYRLEEKIQEDNERRRGIIVTVAHELRTPLQPILGYLNLLTQDPQSYGISDETKKILERCLSSVERERQIINQLLELSVLDSGKLQLSISKFSPAQLVRSVLDTGGYTAKGEITTEIPQGLVISADLDRIYVVLDSLVANAITFSRAPRKIRIYYLSENDDPFHHLFVEDNGVGIPEGSRGSIFEPFQLADAAKLSRKFDRIGLSLSIAKKILKLHGGDITVRSELGKGSTFAIHLPKVVANAA